MENRLQKAIFDLIREIKDDDLSKCPVMLDKEKLRNVIDDPYGDNNIFDKTYDAIANEIETYLIIIKDYKSIYDLETIRIYFDQSKMIEYLENIGFKFHYEKLLEGGRDWLIGDNGTLQIFANSYLNVRYCLEEKGYKEVLYNLEKKYFIMRKINNE